MNSAPAPIDAITNVGTARQRSRKFPCLMVEFSMIKVTAKIVATIGMLNENTIDRECRECVQLERETWPTVCPRGQL
jgi:hypothetical protein